MSQHFPKRSEDAAVIGAVGIVASEYNADYVNGLVHSAIKELELLAPAAEVETHRVPGAFEIPLAVQEIAESRLYDAIIAFGVIIQGETMHAELIGRCVTESLMRVSLEFRVPVIHEVLLLADEAQARRRCLGGDLNRGVEAARTATAMAAAMRAIRHD